MDAEACTSMVNAGMAAATVWMAIETRRMAIAAKASVDLTARPYLAFQGIALTVGNLRNSATPYTGAVRLGIRLKNPGKVLVYYHVPQISATFGGYDALEPRFDSRGGVLHPEEEIIFFYPLIATPAPLHPPAAGEIQFQISFWSVPTERRTLRGRLRIALTSESSHEWNFVEGPSYA